MARQVRWVGYPWKGSRYRRSDGSWRQRQTGYVTTYERKNGRKVKWLGYEGPKKNYYGSDYKANKRARKVWATRVKPNKPTAKKPRSGHRRRYR